MLSFQALSLMTNGLMVCGLTLPASSIRILDFGRFSSLGSFLGWVGEGVVVVEGW